METFPIVPGQFKSAWIWLPLVVLAVVLALVGWAMLKAYTGARGSKFEVSAEGLRLSGDMYGRFVPMADLKLDEAKAVDLTVERNLQPKLRTMGTGLPGYQAGWFRLQNNEKALLYVTDKRRVAYVPTTKGYSVLLSVEDPAKLIGRLRELRR